MSAAFLVHEHPRQRPTWPSLAVHAPHVWSFQRQLQSRVAQLDAMRFPQLLVKVPRVQARALLLI